MFSAFPHDLDPRHFDEADDPPNRPAAPLHPTLAAGSVAAYRRRLAGGALHHTGQTLAYPGALPTSGINPVIVQLRRIVPGTAPSATTPSPSVPSVLLSQPLAQSSLPVRPTPSASAPPVTGPASTVQESRALIVPTISHWDGPAYNKPVVDRVAFNFSQPPVHQGVAGLQSKEVLLESMAAFVTWIKDQQSLQNWLASIKVKCKARMLVHELEDGTVRVALETTHTNHGEKLLFVPELSLIVAMFALSS